MRRPAEIRAPPALWIPVLRESYAFLRGSGIGDLLLYGSQAMSVYMRYPLRSKDIDLVSTQMRPPLLDELTKRLAVFSDEVPKNAVMARVAERGLARTYSIYLWTRGYPLIVEIFDTILGGKDPKVLRAHIRPVSKWNMDFYAPTPEAIVALRLSFSPPERISRLNAVRLNRFIKAKERQLNYKEILGMVEEWGTLELVRDNLKELYKRHKMRILHDSEICPRILDVLKRSSP
ncbi:MAG: hypothetical protein JTT11_03070 [Candidatus Brockarchaeota archaeon]|nr:hypothetical protein [Candidatus Brockarchaeota archaeon]